MILSGQEIVFLERGHKRIFVNFARYLSFKSFGRDDLKRLSFHYSYDTSTIGRGCMNPRVLPDVLIWTISIYDDSQPERTDPRYDLDFNTDPVYLEDLPYESAQELLGNLSVWLPENTELRPLPPLKNAVEG